AVEGSGKWLTSTIYVFRPASAWQPATRYRATVPAGVSDTLGGSLEQDYVWSFTTVSPAVAEVFPETNTIYVGPSEQVRVTFNQPMDKASAEAHFSLMAVVAGEAVRGSFSWQDDSTLVFQTEQPLQPATRYEARVAAGAVAAKNAEAIVKEDFSWSFTTAGLPSIVSTDPTNGATRADPWGVSITFATPMDEESVESNISIEPQQDEDRMWVSCDPSCLQLSISFAMDYSTAYTVTIGGAAKDRYGRSLGEDFVLSFVTAPHPVGVSIRKAGNVGTFDAYGSPQLVVRSWNVADLEFAIHSLDRQTLIRLAADPGKDLDSFVPPSPSLVRRWSVENLDPPQDETTFTTVDLLMEDGSPLQPGYYWLQVWAPGSSARDDMLLVVTKTHLLVKQSSRELLVWAVDMASGQPLPDLPVTVYRSGGGRLTGGVTSDEGVFVYSGEEEGQLFVAADRPDDASLASTEWNQGISQWDFGLPWGRYYGPLVAHIYTDRPIYRPGQTVYYKGILRSDDDASYSLPPTSTSGTIVVRDSMGREVTSEPLALTDLGTFHGELTLGSEAPTGSYWIELVTPQYGRDDYAIESASFLVAEYRKPEFEVEVSTDKEAYENGEEIVVDVDASYFFGAPLKEAPVKWLLTSQDYIFRDPDNPWFVFADYDLVYRWDQYNSSSQEPRAEGEAKTDGDGHLTFHLPADVSTDSVSQTFTVEATVTDDNNQEVSNRTEVIVHKGAFYIGLNPRSYVSQAGEPASVDILTLDSERDVASNVPMTISVYEREWVSVKEKDPEGEYYWRCEPEDTLVETLEVNTDDNGKGSLVFVPAKSGNYRLVAEAIDASGNSVRSATYVWVSGSDYIPWRMDTGDRIELVSDKKKYAPGETAQILVAAPFEQSQGLITIERGQIIDHRVAEFPSNSTIIEIPITSAHIPNIYVSVALFKPPTSSNPVASFKMGYVELEVSTDEKVIQVSIEPNKERFKPRDEVTYTVRTTDVQGRPLSAEVSLALVDAALLSLADDSSPKPLDAFYERRGLGVQTAATHAQSLDRLNQLGGGSPREPGGKGGGGGLAGEVRRIFRDTAYWNPTVRTDDEGQATVSVELPDNLTTWRLTAKAVNEATQVGDATNEIVVAKDLLIRPVTPRFFVSGDTARLEAVVHNYTDQEVEVAASLSATGLAIEGSAVQSVSIPAAESRKVAWQTSVALADQATLTFSAQAANGLSDAVELTLPVYAYVTPEVVGNAGQVTDSVRELVQLPDYIDRERGELTLELSPSLAASMRYSLYYVEEYEYECTEQTISRFLPRLVLYRAINKLGLPDTFGLESELPALVTRSIQRLYRGQNGDGGWGWWFGDTSNPEITAYALFGLAEARDAGFAVDDSVLQRAAQFLQNHLNQPTDVLHPQNADTRAFMLFALSEAGQGDLGTINALAERPETLGNYGKAFVAMALLKLTDDPSNFRIQALISDLTNAAILSNTGTHWQEDEEDYSTMNTATRSTAIVLDALVRVRPDHPLVDSAVRWLMVARRDGHWETTQETAMSLLALTDFLEASGELKADYSYQVRVNGDVLSEKEIEPSDLGESEKLVVSVRDLLIGEDNQVDIARTPADSRGRLYYTMHLRYFPPTEEVEAANYGVGVSR
ncbi:MAG: Ig-like domain-containing protein, partial [Dehalococcoidia bacterium]|nr:Ig-like domain-containing protein [Dehalococcoidia bacterium]